MDNNHVTSAVHFVGFAPGSQRFWNAVSVFGPPDFVHRVWDARAKHGGEWHPSDTMIFATNQDRNSPVSKFVVDDSNVDVQEFEKKQKEIQ